MGTDIRGTPPPADIHGWFRAGRELWLSAAAVRTALIAAAVFIFDCLTPLGLAGGVLYMGAVLSAVPIRHRHAVFITGGVCCVLLLIGWYVSPGRGETELWKVLLNRLLMVGVVCAAVAIAESWRRQQERRSRRLQERQLLHQATALGAGEGSFQTVLSSSIKTLCDIFGWPVGHVYLRESGGEYFAVGETWHLPEDGRFTLLKEVASGHRFKMGEGSAGRVWETKEAMATVNVAGRQEYRWLTEPERLGVAGAFALPLIVRGEVAAVVEFFSEEELTVDSEFSRLATDVGQQLGRLFERRRAEQALRKSEERLRLALVGGQMGTWEWQVDSGRMIWSEEVERMHGLKRGSFQGTLDGFLAQIHAEDRDRVASSLKRSSEAREEFHCEYRSVATNGGERWLESRGAVDRDAVVLRVFGVCMDVTDRKETEVAIRAAKEAAESVNRLRGQLLANVSHELRTPMNVILGLLQLSLGENELSPELRDNLQTARQSAESLLVLLNDLLDFSRGEAEGIQLQASAFDLPTTVQETVRGLRVRAARKRLELICDVEPDVPKIVEGDADRLRQVVSNLTSNAIKFTEDGEVIVEVRVVGPISETSQLQFEVRDTGVGISADDRERIFEPFTQVDAASTRRQGGVGLGLAIASQLVSKMGGEIVVADAPERGTVFSFTLTLPVCEVGDADVPDELQGKRVLIVDDNEKCRMLLANQLTRWGMVAETAVDGDHALGRLHRARLEGEAYDLAVVDSRMPGMTGDELANQVHEFDSPPPIVILREAADSKSNALGEAVAAMVEKPVAPQPLLTAIRKAFGARVSNGHDNASRQTDIPRRILLVEDTPANQKVMAKILRQHGHSVRIACDGEEAVAMFERGAFDLVLMDVQMPNMDGYSATAALREMEQASDHRTPIIALTAHASESHRKKCLSAGMDDYLSKPIDVEALLRVIKQQTGTPRAAVAQPEGTLDVESALSRLRGDRSLWREFVEVFKEDAPGLIRRLETAAETGNCPELQQASHSLRGLAANIGAQVMAELAAELEQSAAAGECALSVEKVGRIRDLYVSIESEIGEACPAD